MCFWQVCLRFTMFSAPGLMALRQQCYSLVNIQKNKKILKIAIEIVDLPMKNGGSFHCYVTVYQRVVYIVCLSWWRSKQSWRCLSSYKLVHNPPMGHHKLCNCLLYIKVPLRGTRHRWGIGREHGNTSQKMGYNPYILSL